MARKASGAGLWGLIVAVALVAMVPRAVWIGLGVPLLIAFAPYLFVKWQGSAKTATAPVRGDEPTLAQLMSDSSRPPSIARSSAPPAPSRPLALPGGRSATPPRPPQPPPLPPSRAPAPAVAPTPAFLHVPKPPMPPASAQSVVEPEFHSARMGDVAGTTRDYAIPKPPAASGQARWVPAGEVVRIAGLDVPGGMLYVGAGLKAANGSVEPSLISEHLNIARHGDYRERNTHYWPSFAEIPATARRAYLNWLAEGRSHPDCDIGLVFLYFYGLERRVILDTSKDASLKSEWPGIASELRRLLGIFGERSGSFLRYAGELLNWIELDAASANPRLYLEPVPDFPRGYELPAYLKLALGQASVDRAPLPARLALTWVRLNPEGHLRTAATRCPEEFGRLFIQHYEARLGRGLVLPRNRTRLKFVYRPASSGFNGATISLGFGDVPDVTALTAPIRTLMAIADACTDALGAFSRLVGKDPAARTSLDGLLQLPATLWPEQARKRIETLRDGMQSGVVTHRLDDVIAMLGGSKQAVNRERVRAVARALETVGIGMEPDVLTGARAPGAADPVVLFALSAGEPSASDTDAYRTAALTLQLASAVAHADGEFSAQETAHLRREIECWQHLSPRSRERLHAHLAWLIAAPMTLASLKKKLEPLEPTARQAVATFMATLAQADGVVSPDEVRFLEKVYKALGVEPAQVFSDIHAVGTGHAPAARATSSGFRLDAARIAELEKDTARVSALLSEIFTEEAVPVPVPVVESEPAQGAGLLGLDEAHSALVRLMLSRPQWSRAELEDAAADLDLMLDGALEQVNEACFEAHDIPLSEGEDPIDIHPDAMEKIEA